MLKNELIQITMIVPIYLVICWKEVLHISGSSNGTLLNL